MTARNIEPDAAIADLNRQAAVIFGFAGADPIHDFAPTFTRAQLMASLSEGSRLRPQTVPVVIGEVTEEVYLDLAPESVAQLYIEGVTGSVGSADEAFAHPDWEVVGSVRPTGSGPDAIPRRVRVVLTNGWGHDAHDDDFDMGYLQYV